MRHLILLVVLFSGLHAFAQDSTKVDTTEQEVLIAGPYNVLDIHVEFFPKETQALLSEWEDFEFYLFNRWGEIMAESKEVSFTIESCMRTDIKILDHEVYVWLVKGVLNGEEKKMQGHTTYLGDNHCH